MQVRDLVSLSSLGLELVTPTREAGLRRTIAQCAPTEHLDPTPFLGAHALVITAGIGMNFQDTSVWDAYVERLSRARVSALAFAVEIAHAQLPEALVRACTKHELPLLRVPPHIPMLKISHQVDLMLREEHFKRMNAGWALADECAHLANQGAELSTILATVYAELRTPLAVYDAYGALLATFPKSVKWSESASHVEERDVLSIALPMGLSNPCRLLIKVVGHERAHLETAVAPVASILALQLSKSSSSDSESLAAMRHFTEMCVAWSEATRQDVAKAFRELGLSQQADTSLLVANMAGDFAAATWQLRIALHDTFQDVRIAEFNDRLIALAQFPRENSDVAADRLLRVDPPVPLVLRLDTRSIDEMRISLVHALDLVGHVNRPTLAPTLGLSSIIAASAGRGARESAHRFLEPLVEHDATKTSQLLPTLRAWLHHDASPARTCEALFIHRNSLSYRLRNIEDLLSVDLTTIEGQATCMMALRLVDLEPY